MAIKENDAPMNEVRTNEKLPEVHNVDMGTVQRRPCWRPAIMICDADEEGSLLWWWGRWARIRSFAFSFYFSFFDIGETFVMGGTRGRGGPVARRRPSRPERITARAKGTETSTHSG